MKKEKEQIRNARLSIKDFGSINVHVGKMYDRGHMMCFFVYFFYSLD